MLNELEHNLPFWAEDEILQWNESELEQRKPFALSHYWNEKASINVFHVKGTSHPDYHGNTWHWLIHNGKRMSVNKALYQDNPDYYLNTEKKIPPMYYVSINGHDWFVDGDGNHRTCIARFDFQMNNRSIIHGVTISDWRIDHELARIYERIQELIMERRLPFSVTAQRETLYRHDNPGWQKEGYRPEIHLSSAKGRWVADNAWEARDMCDYLGLPRFRKWFAVSRFSHKKSSA